MTRNKKTISASLLLVTACAFFSPLAALAIIEKPTFSPPPTTLANVTAVYDLVRIVANWMFAFLLVFGVIFLLVGAFGYLTAGGDAEKQTAARSRIIYALVAIAIGVLALTLVNLVAGYFGGPTTILGV